MSDLRYTVEAVLRTIADPCSIATGAPVDLVDMGLIQSIEIERDTVLITLRLTSPTCWQVGNIIGAIHEKLAPLPAIRDLRCRVDMAAEWTPDMMASSARHRLRALRSTALPA
jgi:metal-sulfur cluster biosynthetic enzyme